MDTTAETPLYRGWHRPRKGRWECRAQGPDYGQCWERLLDAIRDLPSGEALVLKGDETPNHGGGERG